MQAPKCHPTICATPALEHSLSSGGKNPQKQSQEMKHVFSKAKVQYLKHACSRSSVCVNRGMSEVYFTVERHAEEFSSADAAYLLYICFRGLSQGLQCPSSRMQTAEGHVLLKAGFLFLVA